MIINAIAIANGGTTRPPVLEPLNATENGTFTPSTGVDGFNPVNVNVQPPLQSKSVEITANGQSTVVADSNYYGLDSVNLDINVPIPTFQTEELNATANGTYTPSTDGYSKVSVNVQPNLQSKSVEITSNGQSTVVADSSFDGLESVGINVNVPIPTFTTEEKNITANGTYTPSTDGYSKVTVNVQPKLQAKSQKEEQEEYEQQIKEQGYTEGMAYAQAIIQQQEQEGDLPPELLQELAAMSDEELQEIISRYPELLDKLSQ